MTNKRNPPHLRETVAECGHTPHVIVDAEGYRARHEDQLSQMARRLAQRVATEGKVITFDPMSARERRIVHMALRDIKGVRTESMGQEPQRRVQIIPDKAVT